MHQLASVLDATTFAGFVAKAAFIATNACLDGVTNESQHHKLQFC
jgi:hypothetical protein